MSSASTRDRWWARGQLVPGFVALCFVLTAGAPGGVRAETATDEVDEAVAGQPPLSPSSSSSHPLSPSPPLSPSVPESESELDHDDLAWLLDALRVVRPTLLAEADYRVHGREAEGQTGFALARLRLGLIVEPTSWVRAVATVEWVGVAPLLLDAFVTLRPVPWIEVGLGYSKGPLFASFRVEPVHAMPFTERALVVNALRVRRDLGLDVRLAPRELPIEVIARVGNGSGTILGNDNPYPAGYLVLDLVLGRAWTGAPAGDRELGLRVGAAGLVEHASERAGVGGNTAFGFAYYGAPRIGGLRVVGEAHAIGYLGPVRATVEAGLAREERTIDADDDPATPPVSLTPVLSSGLTAELAWTVLGGSRGVGRAPTVAPDSDGSWAGGALEVAARFDVLWLGRDAPEVTPGGAIGGALAIKWWPVDFLAATLIGHGLRYDAAPAVEPGEFWSWDLALRLSLFWGQTPVAAR